MDNGQALQQFQTAIYQNKTDNFEQIKLGLFILQSGDFQQRWDVAKLFPKFGKKS